MLLTGSSEQTPPLCPGPAGRLPRSHRLPIKILLAQARVFFFLVQTLVWERQRNKVLGSAVTSDKASASRHTQGQPHQLRRGFSSPDDKAKVLIKGPLGGTRDGPGLQSGRAAGRRGGLSSSPRSFSARLPLAAEGLLIAFHRAPTKRGPLSQPALTPQHAGYHLQFHAGNKKEVPRVGEPAKVMVQLFAACLRAATLLDLNKQCWVLLGAAWRLLSYRFECGEHPPGAVGQGCV